MFLAGETYLDFYQLIKIDKKKAIDKSKQKLFIYVIS